MVLLLADHFRPLGMANTMDRLIDGAIASHVMSHTAHLLHPSQAVMSCFKEPQKAVTAIQTILDATCPACALLADLSKAFERVNPYWILELLRIRQAPRARNLFFLIGVSPIKYKAGFYQVA